MKEAEHSGSRFLMPLHLLTKFEYKNIVKTNHYSRNNLSKINDGEYTINLDESESIGTYLIALYDIL